MNPLVASWLASGRLVEVVLAGMALEALVLVGLRRVTGRGIAPAELCVNLAAGAALMLAVRAALRGALGSVALWLCAALAAHVVDLALRWRRQS